MTTILAKSSSTATGMAVTTQTSDNDGIAIAGVRWRDAQAHASLGLLT
jgi:hypothetical protein